MNQDNPYAGTAVFCFLMSPLAFFGLRFADMLFGPGLNLGPNPSEGGGLLPGLLTSSNMVGGFLVLAGLVATVMAVKFALSQKSEEA